MFQKVASLRNFILWYNNILLIREERQKLELKASDEAIEYLSCISKLLLQSFVFEKLLLPGDRANLFLVLWLF